MKTKVFKQLIAVLCATMMSASAISSVGAIKYQSDDKLNAVEDNYVNNLNNTIFNMSENIKEMTQIVNSDNATYQKQGMLNTLNHIYQRLVSMHGGNLICSNRTIIVNFDNSISQIKTDIEKTLNLLKSGNIRVNDFNRNIGNIYTQLETLYKDTVDANNTYNSNSIVQQNNLNKQKDSINENNIKSNNSWVANTLDNNVLSNFKNNIINMRNKMLNGNVNNQNASPLQIKLNDKFDELDRRFQDSFKFAQHRRLDTNYIIAIYNQFYNNIRGFNPMSADGAQNIINNINTTIETLNNLTINNDKTIVFSNTLPALRKEANDKMDELVRLWDSAERTNGNNFNGKNEAIAARDFYNNLNLINPNFNQLSNQLRQAIAKLDAAIASLRSFDDHKKTKLQTWEEEASQDIDMLLNEVKNEMNLSSNQVVISGIKREFQPLLCGRQHYGNCWLYAMRNALNFIDFIKNQPQNIVKNTNVLDANGFDNVEKFFVQPQLGLSENKLKNEGGNVFAQSEVLSKLKINHSYVNIVIKKYSPQSRDRNIKIVKTLLLKHFANSINPVLINGRYDEVDFEANNGTGGRHSMLIVGLDPKKNIVAVADSNHQNLQEYSLDRIASVICNGGCTDLDTKTITMIFPSFTNQNNFNYDNNYHSWAEFKSQLLPAISKAL